MTHQAFFYRGSEEYVEGVLRFIGPGVEAGEPVAIAVPNGNAKLLRDRLERLAADIDLLDMVELGSNPARIIPAVQSMLGRSPGRPFHYVGEPIWPGRASDEIREATRHEALINLAWTEERVRVLCPYDASALDRLVLADAERTHPYLLRQHELAPSGAYCGPALPPSCREPLSPPPSEAFRRPFHSGERLSRLRALVFEHARAAGVGEDRAGDLVLSVHELASNEIKHGGGGGVLRIWRQRGRVFCQVEGAGHIADPLAGRRPPSPELEAGVGLWIVNQLCDLVEVRSSAEGTTIRAQVHVE